MSLSMSSSTDGDEVVFALRQEIQELRSEKEKLVTENESLRAQYDDAISIVNQMEPLHTQNKQLSHDLRIAKAERDDLARRLEISIQKIDEMRETSNQREIKKNLYKCTDNSKTLLERKEAENADLQRQIADLERRSRSNEERTKLAIDEVIRNAESFFDCRLSNLGELTALFQEERKKPVEVKEVVRIQPDETSIQELKQLKKHLKKEKKQKQLLEASLAEMEEQMKQQAESAQKKSHDLAAKISAMKKDAKELSADLKGQLEQKSTEVQMLTAALEKQKKLTMEAEEKIPMTLDDESLKQELHSLKTENEDLEAKMSEATGNVALLKNQNKQLLIQIKEADEAKQKMKAKLTEANQRADEAAESVKKAHESIAALAGEKEKLEDEVESLRTHLKTEKLISCQEKGSREDAQIEIQQMKNALDLISKSCDAQKREIAALYNERDRLISFVNKQNNALKSSEEFVSNLIQKNKSQKHEIKQVKTALAEQPVIDPIPPTSWNCPEFPTDLNSLIHEFAVNIKTPDPAKLKHVLLAIAKFYNTRLSEMSEVIEETKTRHSASTATGNQLLSRLADVIGCSETTMASLVEDPGQIEEIAASISRIKESVATTEAKAGQLQADLKLLMSDVNAGSVAQADSEINKLQEENTNLKTELTSLAQKVRQAQRKSKDVIRGLGAEIQELTETINCRNSMIERLEKKNASLTSTLTKTENKVTELENNIVEMEHHQQQQLDEIDLGNQETIKKLQDGFDYTEQTLNDRIEELRSIITEKEVLIEKLNHEISQWQRTSELLTNANRDKDSEVLLLKDEIDERQANFAKQLEAEKTALKEQSDSAISSLKKKNAELHALLDQTTELSKRTEDRNKQLSLKNTQLLMDREQLSARVSSQTEEMERQAQLHSTKLRAVSLSAETNFHNKLEDMKSQFELEKRKIYASAASLFKQYFDARRELNAAEYETILQTVSREVARLSSQDANIRRLLGLEPTESPEEAVSQLIMSLYHS